MERTQEWLDERLIQIWQLLFPEVPKPNKVFIKFKGGWKNKFGHITSKEKDTEIAVNSLFRDPRVPEDVVDLTIAHELIHYTHGFHSPLKRKYKYPHKGGIVTKELKKRGFSHLIKKEKEFFKNKWLKIYYEYFPEKKKIFRWF